MTEAAVASQVNTLKELISAVDDGPDDSLDAEKLARDEEKARAGAASNLFYLAIANAISSIVVFAIHLIKVESVVCIALSVTMTTLVYRRLEDNEGFSTWFDGGSMNWVLLSFAVITPITQIIVMAFNRRETALGSIARIKAMFLEIYTAHAIWDWEPKSGGSGREKSPVDWLEHSDLMLKELSDICLDLTRYLTLPNWTRGRHLILFSERREAHNTRDVAARLQESIVVKFGNVALLCEILKREGLPGNEAARVRQWEQISLEEVARLRIIKGYRTPQALRSFSRLFSVLLPPFYAPYYAQMAHDLNSLGTAIAFSVITSLALTSLFESVSQMEDPFVESSVLDGIHVKAALLSDFALHIRVLRKSFFPEASKYEDPVKELKSD